MIGNRNIGSPQNKNNQMSFQCKNDKLSLALSKPPQFSINPYFDAKFNKKDFQSQNSVNTLKFQQLGKEVLQFKGKQSSNRLKARHKRLMTMEIQGQSKITNHLHNFFQLEENSFSQLSFETKNNFSYSNNGFHCKTKTQSQGTMMKSKSVRKNLSKEESHQRDMCGLSQIKKKNFGYEMLQKNNKIQKGKQCLKNLEKIKVKGFVGCKINENQSCSSDITKTKACKWIMNQTKQLNQSQHQQIQSPSFQSASPNHFISKITKKRSVSSFQNYIQNNIYKPSILQKQTSDGNHTSNSSSKETVYYGRVSLQKTNRVSNRQQSIQNFNLENQTEKTSTKPHNQTHKKLGYSGFIQNSISTSSLKKHTQSVQEESEPSSSQQKQYEEIITTRLGIAKSLNNTHKKKNPKNSIGKLSDLNDELDLGLKLIDNSFEVSGFDYDYTSSNIFSNRQECEQNQLHHQLKTCCTGKSENQTSKQEVILDESLISPECEALKNKLNRILQKNSNQFQQQQKFKFQRLSSEVFTEIKQVPRFDLCTTLKNQQNQRVKYQSNPNDSKYESYLYGSFIFSKNTIEEKRKMLQIETFGLRFDLKIGMLTHETVYLISHTKQITKLINIISKIKNFPKLFHIIQPYSLNFYMCSNRLILIKDPILLANKFEMIYPMMQANVLRINLLQIRKIIKQVLSVMYQSISAQFIFVDIRDIYLLVSKNRNKTEFNVKIDIAQSFLSQVNTEQFQNNNFGQNVETVLKIIRILTSTDFSCHNYDMKTHLQSFVDLLEETLTGNKQTGIEEIFIHPFVWNDSN